jgi:thermitase
MARPRPVRRATTAFRLEALEARTLMSMSASPDPVGPWNPSLTADPSRSVLIRFTTSTPDSQVQADLKAVGGRVVESYPNGPSLVQLPAGSDRSAALARLKADAGVVYAEADSTLHASALTVTPNDPYYAAQWGLSTIDAPAAWGFTTGTSATIVAVLDTGIDLRSSEFAGKIWTNPNSSGGDGFRGDVHGWNFVNNSSNVQDNNGHGTHVTGILAANTNNAVGVAGVDWNARIMPVKILDSQGNGTTDAAVSGVYFAVQHGARVINASWGGDQFSQAMLDALNYANNKGVVFVTAAGNDASNNDVFTTYPASYRTPNELVVAALDPSGTLANFSNFGPTTVDLAAPGVNIISTIPGSYAVYSGTSMSTPYVAGTVALLAGLNPGYSAAQLVAQVRATVKPLASLKGLLISPGVVDPFYALIDYQALSARSTPPPPSTVPVLVPGGSPFTDVEAAILTSDSVYQAAGGNDAGYVTYLYDAVFGRNPVPGELSFYSAGLQAASLTRSDLVRTLQSGPEGLLTRAARLYVDELGVSESVNAAKGELGVGNAAKQLAAGWSFADVQAGIFSNDQYYIGAGNTPARYVSALYQALLGRAADPGSLAAYTAELNSGTSRGTVVRQILATPEGHLATIANLFRDELGWTVSVVSLKASPGVAYWAGFLGLD